ncbi:MAG: glycosyltransferase family 4 protein [Actinomycetota bacterium]|nr:glycosyltransferase family 4 protein [Actinomycetota bacterium]
MAAVAPSVGIELSIVSLMSYNGQRHGVALRRLGVNVTTAGLSRQWDPRGFRRAERLVGEANPAVLHSHQKQADLVAAVIGRRLRVPMVSTMHRIEDEVSPLGRVKRRLSAEARMRRAVRTIAVSNAQRSWYLDAFHDDTNRVVTIHNGVRPPAVTTGDDGRRVRRELGISEDAVVATMLGVMRPGKGHRQLIAADARLAPGTRLRFVCAGDGPLADELGREADELGREAVRRGSPEARIIFPGWRSDVGAILAASDMIVHPTLFDALPTALIQGLAAGLPAVASNVGGVPEIVSSDCGILVAPDDPAALADALQALAEDPQKRAKMGAAARARFDTEFAADIWAGRLRALYDTVVAT